MQQEREMGLGLYCQIPQYPTLPDRQNAKTTELLRHLFRLIVWRFKTRKIRKLLNRI